MSPGMDEGAVKTVSLTWDEVIAWRLARHHLNDQAAGRRAADISQGLLGLHAQLQSTAEWSVMVRTEDLMPADVRRELEDGCLVKTWMMRGTLHLLKAEDLPLFAAARGRYRRDEITPSFMRYHGVTPQQLAKVRAAIPEALSGRQLTRGELAREVARIARDPSLVAPLESGWGSLLKSSAYAGDLCFGPPLGRQVTFVHAREQWRHLAWDTVSADAALIEIARRYLATFGPAAREDFARWWGCSPGAAGRALRAVDGVTEVDMDGFRGYALFDDVDAIKNTGAAERVKFLPPFDPYVVGFAPRGHAAAIPPDRHTDVYRAQGWMAPVIVHAGRMVATWQSQRRARHLELVLVPLEPISPGVRRQCEEEAERIADRLAAAAKVRWADR